MPKASCLPNFLFVSNMKAANPKDIIRGNERVLRARLSDARFFYDQDRKTRLEERRAAPGERRVPTTSSAARWGASTASRKLAGEIARLLQADAKPGGARRAARQGRSAHRHGR